MAAGGDERRHGDGLRAGSAQPSDGDRAPLGTVMLRTEPLPARWAIACPLGEGRLRLRSRPGRCATLAAVRASTFGRIAGGVPLLAAVRLTLLAIFGSARIAFGPPLATRVLAALVAALAACLRWVGDIEAPRSLITERAASPATTGSARAVLDRDLGDRLERVLDRAALGLELAQHAGDLAGDLRRGMRDHAEDRRRAAGDLADERAPPS